MQCHGNFGKYIEVKKINYTLEVEILRNSSQVLLGVLKGSLINFRWFGVQITPSRPAG